MNSTMPDADTLRRLYWDEGMSLEKIGVLHGGKHRTIVMRWFRRCGIPLRSKSDAAKNRGDNTAGMDPEARERLMDRRREFVAEARKSITQAGRRKQTEALGKWHQENDVWNKGVPWSDELREKHMEVRNTDEYRRNLSVSVSGEKGPNWKGGVSANGYARLSTWQWRKRRKEVYERDADTCQRCGVQCESGGPHRRQCHHIIPADLGGSDEMENLTALCNTCHKTVEWTYRKKLKGGKGQQLTFLPAE